MGERNRLSYVEVVIIAVILGASAVGVAPKFAKAEVESKVSNLIDGLEKMRVQLDLYRAQHNDSFPPCDSFESFQKAMTRKMGRYGSCMKEIPVNPFNNLRRVRFNGMPAGAGVAGWRFDTQSGLLQADNNPDFASL